jgi:glycosyltransferase involved in cell wall biosynthesis
MPRLPGLQLHVAGSGSGPEGIGLRRRMRKMKPAVILHGQLDQLELARLMRRCAVCVLPSLYEGVPLVLIEALACGCRLVSTDLPGVRAELASRLGEVLTTIPLPALVNIDRPASPDVPAFVANLARALDHALRQPPLKTSDRGLADLLAPFTWAAVFRRIEAVWLDAMAGRHASE